MVFIRVFWLFEDDPTKSYEEEKTHRNSTNNKHGRDRIDKASGSALSFALSASFRA
jgi:hypothetical protein